MSPTLHAEYRWQVLTRRFTRDEAEDMLDFAAKRGNLRVFFAEECSHPACLCPNEITYKYHAPSCEVFGNLVKYRPNHTRQLSMVFDSETNAKAIELLYGD